MRYRLTVGQNQWLIVEYITARGRSSTFQVIESHRLPQVKVGDLVHRDKKNMFVVYPTAAMTRPSYRLPSHTQISDEHHMDLIDHEEE
tara:strand:- start:427 stop:690 length:264 start_codon:yes stop_codon:yes gene_type:complete